MTRRPITADDLCAISTVQDPRLSAEAQAVVFAVREVDRARDGYRSGLRIVPLAGGPVRDVTTGPSLDHSPRWSPDGRRIAFISNRSGADQLWIVTAEGGEPRAVAAQTGGASSPLWSPDGRRLAFLSRVLHNRGPHPTAPGVHVITRLKYKTDRGGLWDGRYAHLHVIDPARPGGASEAAPLTAGPHDVLFPVWSPDGRRLAYLANPSPDADESATLDVWVVDVEEKRPARLTHTPGPKAGLAWSPDGSRLAFAGHEDPFGGYHTTWGLWVVPATGGIPRRVTDRDVGFGDRMLTDLFGFDWSAGPVWSRDGRLYALANVRGSTHLLAVVPDTGRVETITPGDVHVYAFDAAGGTAVWAAASATRLPALFATTAPRGLAEPNRELEQEIELAQPESLTVRGDDGVESEAWLLCSPIAPGRRRPLVLHVHGGPHAQCGHSFMHEFQLLAAAGYAVLFANPRGSTGYGDWFAGASRRAWGQADFEDLMAALDQACRDPRVDPNRLGVTGGSYGGFMTNWIIGHTDRFTAAVTDRSLSNLVSFMGTSEIAHTFGLCELGRVEYETLAGHREGSPLAYVSRIGTPLLILHSERDQQTPIEQAEQLYLALKLQRKPVEFIRFEDETHELSRSGRPSRRLIRLYHLLRWFDQHLRPGRMEYAG